MQLLGGVGSSDLRNYRMNAISAPSNALPTAVPYAFPSYVLLYDRYRVWKCSWRAEFSLVYQVPATVAVRFSNNAIPSFSTWDNFLEQPRTISLALGPSGQNVKVIKGQCYLPKLHGVTKKEYMDDDYASFMVTGAFPTDQMPLLVAAQSDVASWAVQCKLTLVFYAELFDPRSVVL